MRQKAKKVLGLIGDETLPDAAATTAPSAAANPAAPAVPPAPEVDLMSGFDEGEAAVAAGPAPSPDDLIGAFISSQDPQTCCAAAQELLILLL